MIYLLEQCFEKSRKSIGGKAAWLAWLHRHNRQIPRTLCLSTTGYFSFLDHGNLREKISMELYRKKLEDMRWEEIWDISLRIRTLFLKSSIPPALEDQLRRYLDEYFSPAGVVVRSSAPTEDQAGTSFAGLHDSFVNVTGLDAVGTAVKKVWASLWSDRAILYRKELALSTEESGMAVIIQELVNGEASGVCFTRDPLERQHMSIEAVHGLNQGLVDGTIAPDRWLVSPADARVMRHNPPNKRQHKVSACSQGTCLSEISDQLVERPPLDERQVVRIAETTERLHFLFGAPLDIEWTIRGETLYLLQARPVTGGGKENEGDRRSWYLSLHRSFDNLVQLRHTIEEQMLPAMSDEADTYASLELGALSDQQLAEQIRLLQERSSYWTERYWRDCIPFAHGIRLFGEIYNEIMVPDDPHEFVTLLQGENMLSMQRNAALQELAEMLRDNPRLAERLRQESSSDCGSGRNRFDAAFDELVSSYGSYFASIAESEISARELFGKIIVEYAKAPSQSILPQKQSAAQLRDRFFRKLSATDSNLDGAGLLDLARASYRLRDDDNIYLGRIEEQAARTLREGKRRLSDRGLSLQNHISAEEVAGALEGTRISVRGTSHLPERPENASSWGRARARQLIGQPASKGIARGLARVVHTPQDTADFKHGEVLVVESIEPTMTFFAPLAAAIVEQRGGMLIHGAIIAREYGIPCVTGIAQAMAHIQTGDHVTVDGYLGIVTIERTG